MDKSDFCRTNKISNIFRCSFNFPLALIVTINQHLLFSVKSKIDGNNSNNSHILWIIKIDDDDEFFLLKISHHSDYLMNLSRFKQKVYNFKEWKLRGFLLGLLMP